MCKLKNGSFTVSKRFRTSVSVPITGVRYNSLLWMCTLSTLTVTSVQVQLNNVYGFCYPHYVVQMRHVFFLRRNIIGVLLNTCYWCVWGELLLGGVRRRADTVDRGAILNWKIALLGEGYGAFCYIDVIMCFIEVCVCARARARVCVWLLEGLFFGLKSLLKFVLFNDATGTHWFLSYHRLLDVIHMVTLTHFLEGNPLPPHRLLFSISSKGSFICTFP